MDMLVGEERAGREEEVQLADTILGRLLCDMFGVEPRTEPELLCRDLLPELAGEAVDRAGTRKKSVILPAKQKKKHFSIFDEIPEELLEKRRSSRNPVSLGGSAETSCEAGGGGRSQRELLISFLPVSIRAHTEEEPAPATDPAPAPALSEDSTLPPASGGSAAAVRAGGGRPPAAAPPGRAALPAGQPALPRPAPGRPGQAEGTGGSHRVVQCWPLSGTKH